MSRPTTARAVIRSTADRVLRSRTYDRHAYDDEIWQETLDDLADSLHEALESRDLLLDDEDVRS